MIILGLVVAIYTLVFVIRINLIDNVYMQALDEENKYWSEKLNKGFIFAGFKRSRELSKNYIKTCFYIWKPIKRAVKPLSDYYKE